MDKLPSFSDEPDSTGVTSEFERKMCHIMVWSSVGQPRESSALLMTSMKTSKLHA
jgi:hypothetical protein